MSSTRQSDISARVRIDMGRGVSLLFRNPGSGPCEYPTNRIQKGLILAYGNREMAEEGLGFGVPLLKFGYETVFPGNACVTSKKDSETPILKVNYDLNLVERKAVKSRKSINNKAFYKIKEHLSKLYRKHPPLRGIFWQVSKGLRLICDIETRFENIPTIGTASVIYSIHPRRSTVHVSVNLCELRKDGDTEIIIINEQGANHFNQYHDSNGIILNGDAIGAWDETFADEASLIDSCNDIVFTLQKVKGARMFRGRELVASRLAWSGLNYVISPHTVNFTYTIMIGAAT